MNTLQISVENSYSDYCKSLQTFWKEDELYGSTSPENKIVPQDL